MNILAHSKTYLVGQIENDPQAAGWREELAGRLKLIEPTLKIWDPLIKPSWVHPDVCSAEAAFGWKKFVSTDDKRGEQCYSTNIAVRRLCKQLVGKCDFVIARLTKTFTWGSLDELEIACNRRIPIFLWMPESLVSIYGLAGCIYNYETRFDYIHDNIDSLLNAIESINNGTLDVMKRDPETWMCLTWKNAAETNDANKDHKPQ